LRYCRWRGRPGTSARRGQHDKEDSTTTTNCGASLRWRRKRGASEQAIGITKGGRNSKIHGLVDKLCRPWVLILTPGNTADCTVGPACVSLLDGIAE